MTPPESTSTAFILSGGGANGAYEVGVMKALLEGASPATGHRPVDPEILTGTSVGAYNAAFLAASPQESARDTIQRLEEIWLKKIARTSSSCGNGVFRIRGLPLQFLDPGCLGQPARTLARTAQDGAYFGFYSMLRTASLLGRRGRLEDRLLQLVDYGAFFSVEPLERLVRETLDLAGLGRSSKKLVVAASDWKKGELRLFERGEVASAHGHDIILASTAIPGIFPPVVIGGVPYVDGGVLMNTPLRPAIRAGAESLHVIYLDPFVREIPLDWMPSSIDTMYRLFALLWSASLDDDVQDAEEINRGLALLAQAADLPATGEAARRFVAVAERLYQRLLASSRPYRPLVIHRYRPAQDLGGGGGLLNFDQKRLEEVIALGYQDAVHHDCQKNGCAVPPEEGN